MNWKEIFIHPKDRLPELRTHQELVYPTKDKIKQLNIYKSFSRLSPSY